MLGILLLAATVLFLTRLCCVFDEEREAAASACARHPEKGENAPKIYDISDLYSARNSGKKRAEN